MVKLDGASSRHEVAGDGWNGYGRADLDLVALLPLQGLDGQNGTAPWVAPATATVCGQDMVAAGFPSAMAQQDRALAMYVGACVRVSKGLAVVEVGCQRRCSSEQSMTSRTASAWRGSSWPRQG